MGKLYLKNFVRCILYILLIVAIIFLGVLVAGAILSISTSVITSTSINGINVEKEKLSLLTNDIFNYYFSNPLNILNNIINVDGIKEIVVNDLLISSDEANAYSNALYIWNLVSCFVILLSMIIAYLIASMKIRRILCPRSLKRFVIVFIIKKILDILIVNSITLLLTKYEIVGIISTVILVVINTLITLFIAYLSQHKKGDNIMIYNIINHKTIFVAILMTIVMVSLTLLINLLFYKYIGILTLIFGLPLFIYTYIIVSLTPEAYVKNYKKIER